MEKFNLAVVQSHSTQFDGPLFRRLSRSKKIKLVAYFTNPDGMQGPYDPEIGCKSGWDHDISSGYEYLFFPSGLLSRFVFIRNIIDKKFDLVIVGGYTPLINLVIAFGCRLAGIPVGLRCDSTFLRRERNIWRESVKNIILPRLFRVFGTGHPTGSLAEVYLRHYGFRAESLFFFPYNVDNDYFAERCDRSLEQQDVIKRKYDIGKNDFIILGVLKFIPRENPITLLKAFARIASGNSNVHLIMIGDGQLSKEINRMVRSEDIKNVHLPGYVSYSHLPYYYAIADVFVHPAVNEPWGVSVNEAMACGIPVIAADTVGAGADLIVSGQTGFIFKAGEPESLAAYLKLLMSTPALGKEMAKKAKDKIRQWSYTQTETALTQALQYVTRKNIN